MCHTLRLHVQKKQKTNYFYHVTCLDCFLSYDDEDDDHDDDDGDGDNDDDDG